MGFFDKRAQLGHRDVDGFALIVCCIARQQDAQVIKDHELHIPRLYHEANIIQNRFRINRPKAVAQKHTPRANASIKSTLKSVCIDLIV